MILAHAVVEKNIRNVVLNSKQRGILVKKILLMASLLVSYHPAIADCFMYLTYTFYVRNMTDHPINLYDCTGGTDPGLHYPDIDPGHSGSLGPLEIGGATYNVVSCHYQDKTNHQTGTLEFKLNTCEDITTATTNDDIEGSNTLAFSCPSVSTAGSILSGYFAINKSMTYTIVWNDILLSLSKGQVMVNKLAHSLAASENTVKQATYDGKKITMVIQNISNPYPENASYSQCRSINNT